MPLPPLPPEELTRWLKVCGPFVGLPALVILWDVLLRVTDRETISEAFWALRPAYPQFGVLLCCALSVGWALLVCHFYSR